MAKLSPSQVKIVAKIVSQGLEEEAIFGTLEGMEQSVADRIISGMGSKLSPSTNEPATFEVSNIKKEYVPKPVDYDLNKPEELAMAISQKKGIPYQEAYEEVAMNPRTSRALQEGNSFPILSRVGDEITKGFRGLSGLSAMVIGEDPYERMANPVRDDAGWFDSFIGNVANDPLTYTGAPVAKGISKLGGQAIAQSPKWLSGMKEGAIASLGEFGLTQAQQAEEGKVQNDGLLQGAIQTTLGGTMGSAVGKYSDVLDAKQAIKDSPNILKKVDATESAKPDDLIEIDYSGQGGDVIKDDSFTDIVIKNPKQHRQRIIQDVMDGTGFSKKQAESVPPYARGVFANIDDKGKNKINEYITIADTHLNDGMSKTPFDVVGDMFVKGEKAIDQARIKAGQTMGDIEKQYLSGANGGVFDGAIDTNPFKTKWAELMAEYGGMVRKVGDDGKVSYESTINKKMVPENDRIDFAEIDKEINELGDFVTGEYLRSLEKNMSKIMRQGKGVSTRSGKMNSEADVATNKMISMGRDLIGDQIEANGGKEARDLYNASKKDYAKYWTAQDFIQRRLGKGLQDESGETMARGASMVSAMLNSNQDRNTKTLARMINNLNGEDIGKHAIMAKFAMQTAGDKKGGTLAKLPKTQGEYVSRAIDWGIDKVTHKGALSRDFEGMTSMVEKAQPKQATSFLDLISNNPIANATSGILSNYGQPALRSGFRSLGNNNEQ